MVLGLAAMPLCALVAVVLLTFQKYHSDAVNTPAMNQGLVVLPFVLLTSIVLLFAVLILADHQRLERANQLSGSWEVYYQGLRQQESQVRQLRHDLCNHLTVIQGLLKKSDPQGAIDYLEQMAGSPALQGRRRFCDNETANVVLFPPKRKPWSGWELRWILPYLSPGIFQWPTTSKTENIIRWNIIRCWKNSKSKKSPHSTRHTYATRAIKEGLSPEMIQAILSHSDYSTTVNFYNHFDPKSLVHAVDSFAVTNKLLSNSKD